MTTKSAFLWAGLAVAIVKSTSKRIEDIDLLASLYESVRRQRQELREAYAMPSLEISSAGEVDAFGPGLRKACSDVMSGFLQSLKLIGLLPAGLDGQLGGLEGQLVNQAIKKGYKELMDKDLISDPVLGGIGEAAIAAIGVVPYSFTKKTNKGETSHVRVKALLWSYE
ncbi:MAG: hypothetical protein JOZ31_15260, partial [Verrucomicrobia bacterium]|nr:hypothetical protein [Verrucomicrobiota bacterium]